VWVGCAALEPWPSPKIQLRVSGSPSGSKLAALEKSTSSGTTPASGAASAIATGAVLPGMPV
jgi:hypothetical protein